MMFICIESPWWNGKQEKKVKKMCLHLCPSVYSFLNAFEIENIVYCVEKLIKNHKTQMSFIKRLKDFDTST